MPLKLGAKFMSWFWRQDLRRKHSGMSVSSKGKRASPFPPPVRQVGHKNWKWEINPKLFINTKQSRVEQGEKKTPKHNKFLEKQKTHGLAPARATPRAHQCQLAGSLDRREGKGGSEARGGKRKRTRKTNRTIFQLARTPKTQGATQRSRRTPSQALLRPRSPRAVGL